MRSGKSHIHRRTAFGIAYALALAIATPALSQDSQENWPPGLPPPGKGLEFVLPPQWSLGFPNPTDNSQMEIFGPDGTKVICRAMVIEPHNLSGRPQSEIDAVLKDTALNQHIFDGLVAGEVTARQVSATERDGETVVRGSLVFATPNGKFRVDGLYRATPTLSYLITCGGLEADWAATTDEAEKIISTFRVKT